MAFYPNYPGEIKAKNMRTGGVGYISWKAFQEVGVRETCACGATGNVECGCEYVNFAMSMANRNARG